MAAVGENNERDMTIRSVSERTVCPWPFFDELMDIRERGVRADYKVL